MVLGAGVAGLAAARELSQAGLRVSVFHERIAAALRPRRKAGRDVAFGEYLRRRRSLPARDRALVRLYVEGYYAARLERVSADWLAEGEEGGSAGQRQYRIADGYDALVAWLRAGLDPGRVEVRLNTVVRDVEWRAGEVVVRGRTGTGLRLEPVRARALVVTLPLAVLKAAVGEPGAVQFRPPLRSKHDALGRLEVGHVCKLVLRFRDRFWDQERFVAERLRGRGLERGAGTISFWHDGALAVPTWWTAAPRHVPVLTAWAGGPAAEALLGRGDALLVSRALDALASLMRVERRWVEERLEAWAWHDWRADPFARGAYTYAGVAGASAPDALGRPLDRTLFFAGEATDRQQTGTVPGAVASGRRAARELISHV